MIIDIRQEDIISSCWRYIAFAVNCEGFNDSGFAGMIARRYWPELANTKPQKLGTILSKEIDEIGADIGGGRIFFALVCHSLRPDGWKDTPRYVQTCLDQLASDKSEIAIVMIGGGPVGRLMGANVMEIMAGMARSFTPVRVYSL